jgi:hypothetical protein
MRRLLSADVPSVLRLSAFVISAGILGLAQLCGAQDNNSWNSTSQSGNPDGALNPTRTRETHTEVNGRIIDKTIVETLGPDGRYVPYSETDRETVRVDNTTIRNSERTFGTGPDGQKTLIQQTQEETRDLPGGEQRVVRTVSSPDANGALQTVRRESEDSKQISPGVRITRTTVSSPDINGGLTPTVQIEKRESKGDDGTLQTRTSTQLNDESGGWRLAEIKESTSSLDAGRKREDERILRPDSNGDFKVVERTVTNQGGSASGGKRDTTETYSTNVPGQAGDDNLQLVQRETTVSRSGSTGGQNTIRQVERARPGDPRDSFQVTEETIDIVRPGSSGVAAQTRTVLAPGSDGQLGTVWIDMGKSDKPAAVQVDTGASAPAPK